MASHFIYILTNKPNGTLYIGVTTDIKRRVWQHRSKEIDGFTARYGLDKLVYFEIHEDYWEAANREKRMKKWNRQWKIALIEKENPYWADLYDTL